MTQDYEYEHWRWISDAVAEFKRNKLQVSKLDNPELMKLLNKALLILQREQLKAYDKIKIKEE
jgi:hypothetical protein